ncbi:hypothetical protein CEXT_543411 [Caerostris extrusa]|uniref:Uncharacterized protein n=1 Tax=Caerostris extrusa TaxID=172846 RepID=A0AAV4VQW4_CAEEX|nr:hypothetical protein CEXT_543411 [Caerostris extrusa]
MRSSAEITSAVKKGRSRGLNERDGVNCPTLFREQERVRNPFPVFVLADTPPSCQQYPHGLLCAAKLLLSPGNRSKHCQKAFAPGACREKGVRGRSEHRRRW